MNCDLQDKLMFYDISLPEGYTAPSERKMRLD